MLWLKRILDIIFPDRCVGCGSIGRLLCLVCESSIQRCGVRKDIWIGSVFSYKDPKIQRLVWLLKYGNAIRVATYFGHYMAEGIQDILSTTREAGPVFLIPVPLSSVRRRERGYNQSELLVREIMNYLPAKSVCIEKNLLLRKHTAVPQAKTKNRAERITNMTGCFTITTHSISKSSVLILIDDVVTTGATLLAARQALLDAGYVHIYAQTAAH